MLIVYHVKKCKPIFSEVLITIYILCVILFTISWISGTGAIIAQFSLNKDKTSRMKTVCVYCGSSDKMSEEYLQSARQMGASIAQRGFTLAYGAGCTGMMGAVADGALAAGGEVIGVIPEMFTTPTLMHNGLSRLEIVADMHARKKRLVDISDAFIALPGGYGTFEELFEVLTWAQIGLHHKPVGLLNTQHYFDPLLIAIEHARGEGFIYSEHRSLFVYDDQPASLRDLLVRYKYPQGMDKWLTREE
jgi:uncharacterized protein (TIGR00730 family)